ncbi:hypothetical protein Ddye_002168 [Dipteronia dyeriana]|uniref:Cytochrome P450 n=1 Tax=Dipteronia dyeriana TaxID=168575 RepID=A0AAE0CU84_9ROSI|nr:hypothetical protein Ddye_002168 [Dipteronia dyeriana]
MLMNSSKFLTSCIYLCVCVSDYIPYLRRVVNLDDYEKDIILATMDNPSNAVEWVLAEMINQLEILEKANEELDRMVGKERLVEESDFCQRNFIKSSAREAFELHPIEAF